MMKLMIAILLFLGSHSAQASGGSCRDVLAARTDADAMVRDILDPATNEKLTIEVMRQVAERTANHQDTVVGWLDSIKATLTNHPLNLLEHSALLFILKSGAFDGDAAATGSLEATLSISYLKLTGREPVRDDIRSPLPQKLFGNRDERAQLFHNAIFDYENETVGLRGRIKRVARKMTPMNIATTILGVAALSFEPGREIFTGALIGLTGAAFNEYLIHIGVGHAPKGAVKAFRKWGAVGKFLEEITMTHKLHHTIVAQDFGAAVLTPEQKAKADKTLAKMVENLTLDRMRDKNPETTDDQIRNSEEFKKEVEYLVTSTQKAGYGTNGTALGAVGMLATAAPFYLLNHALYAATGSHAFLISADISLTGMIIQSLYSHWHFHFRPDEHPEMKVNAFQAWYMTTPVGKLSQRLHFTHHETPYAFERTKNGDIMAGSVADRIKGDLKQSTVLDLIGMYQQRFLGEIHAIER